MKIKVTKDDVVIMEEDTINKGEYNLHKCYFEFSDDYTDDLDKYVVFDNYCMLIEDNACDIPDEVLKQIGKVILGVYAENEEKRYSPKPTNFDVEDGSFSDELIAVEVE